MKQKYKMIEELFLKLKLSQYSIPRLLGLWQKKLVGRPYVCRIREIKNLSDKLK